MNRDRKALEWSERGELKDCNRDGQKEGIGRNRDAQQGRDRKESGWSGKAG